MPNKVGAGPNKVGAGPSEAGPSAAGPNRVVANRVGANIKKKRQNIKNALLGAREQDVDIEKQNY